MTSTYSLCWIEVKRYWSSCEVETPRHCISGKQMHVQTCNCGKNPHLIDRREGGLHGDMGCGPSAYKPWPGDECVKGHHSQARFVAPKVRAPGRDNVPLDATLVVGHNLNVFDAHKTTACTPCIQGKFCKRPSKWQLLTELPLLCFAFTAMCVDP